MGEAMKRRHYEVGCRHALAVAAVLCSVTLGQDRGVTVKPQDSGEALVNPGMGWTLHFYSNLIENYGSKLEPSDTLDDWPGLSVVYLRVPWSFLEPNESQFNWALFDTPGQRWIAKGKQIAIRVSCCESWLRYATPKWVQDAGAKGLDYHASYMSIHWWPREELNENRQTIDQINRRMGYRLQLREISWPGQVRLGEPFEVQTAWANAGVAPCYPGGFWALTLKDAKGGIVSVNVDEDFDVRTLRPGPPGEPPTQQVQSRFTVAFRHLDPRGNHAPPTQPGDYDAFVSVGLSDGTPVFSLPLADSDGQRRYRLGTIRLLEAR